MPKAVEYVLSVLDQVPGMDELLQMSIIEVIKLDCKKDSIHRVGLALFSIQLSYLVTSQYSLGSSY
jgi:coatomer subunit beta